MSRKTLYVCDSCGKEHREGEIPSGMINIKAESLVVIEGMYSQIAGEFCNINCLSDFIKELEKIRQEQFKP